ncbi:hypothetical protein NQZ79_g3624 [Umbelopsis isabellina]|nr:hypothetical protein NQZ79_g3624 [Umbelopsis isabellina]
MESFQLELHPDKGSVHVALFKNVKNAPDLRQRLLSQDTTLSVALVNATLVVSKFQILLAVNKAVHKEASGKLKTHNVNSEIVYDFSSTNNISQSLRRYGVADDSTALIVIKVGGDPSETENIMKTDVHGELVSLSSIPEFTDMAAVRKYYQLNDKELPNDAEGLMPLIAGAMALKEVK